MPVFILGQETFDDTQGKECFACCGITSEDDRFVVGYAAVETARNRSVQNVTARIDVAGEFGGGQPVASNCCVRVT